MKAKIDLSLLILLDILFQMISAFSKENIEGSSNILIRKKRLIDRTLGGNRKVLRENVPYIVNLRQNGFSKCGASILSPNVVITTAQCVRKTGVNYTILAGSAKRNYGSLHFVRSIQIYDINLSSGFEHDLALLAVYPRIILDGIRNRKIELYDGPLHPGILTTLSGWGCINIVGYRLMYPMELRSIDLPILVHQDCHNTHRNVSQIGGRDIRTGDIRKQKGICSGDAGGPLTINGELAGVISWDVGIIVHIEAPVVSMNLAFPPYRNWITSTVAFLESTVG